MTPRNAPLTPQGRLRLVLRCRHRPIAHIAAEAGVSRQCLGKWVARYREHGEAGLHDRSSAPAQRPTQTPVAVVEQIAVMRKNKWSARRIVRELAAQDIPISVATVTRWLHKLGLARLDHLDVDGEPLRRPGTIKAWWPGHMIHTDVKKVGRIPDGGGRRIHGINSDQARAAARATAKAKASGTRPGYVYLHSAVDGFSRLATPRPAMTSDQSTSPSRSRATMPASIARPIAAGWRAIATIHGTPKSMPPSSVSHCRRASQSSSASPEVGAASSSASVSS